MTGSARAVADGVELVATAGNVREVASANLAVTGRALAIEGGGRRPLRREMASGVPASAKQGGWGGTGGGFRVEVEIDKDRGEMVRSFAGDWETPGGRKSPCLAVQL